MYVWVCIYVHTCTTLRSSKSFGSLDVTLILNESIIEFGGGHLYLIAYKIQGIKKQAFGVKYDEILAYFIKSWI